MPSPGVLNLSRRGSMRTLGLVAAAVLGLIFAAVLAYFALGARRGGSAHAPVTTQPNDGQQPPTLTTPPQPIGGGGPAAAVGPAKEIVATFASRNDPSKVAGRFECVELEPLEAKRYRATAPQSFMFLKDGRTLYVRADTAEVFMPVGTTDQPDAGTLEGNVKIQLFAPRPDGSEIEPGRDRPLAQLLTSTLLFDRSTGAFAMPEKFVVKGDAIDFAGLGLTGSYNERLERLDSLAIRQSEPLRLRPKAARPAHPARADPAPSAGGATPAPVGERKPGDGATDRAGEPPPAAPAGASREPPKESFYAANFLENASVISGGREISGDTMHLWFHLVDNQLMPNAIADGKPERPSGTAPKPAENPPDHVVSSALPSGEAPTESDTRPTPAADTLPRLAGVTSPTRPAAPIADATGRGSDEVVISWSGPMDIKPIDTRPPELAWNEVAVRFTSNSDRPVKFSDADSGARGAAAMVEYSATTRDVALQSPKVGGVALALPRAGDVTAKFVKVNLNTGVAQIQGPGELKSSGSGTGLALAGSDDFVGPPVPLDPSKGRWVRWSEQADFVFASHNGTMTGAVLSATLAGDVLGIDRASNLNAQWLQADFTPTGPQSSVLAKLVAKDNVSAGDGRGGAVQADHLGIIFARRQGSDTVSDPSVITLTGHAVASRRGSTLNARVIEARLEPDASGRAAVAEVEARDEVFFSRDDGVWAQADELRANVAAQTADLLGDDTVVAKDLARILGTQMRLDGANRTLLVQGAGAFELDRAESPLAVRQARAEWTREMTFDDRAGVIECRGGIRGELNPDPTVSRTLAGDRLRLEITPGTTAAAPSESEADAVVSIASDPANTDPASSRPERKLLRASVFGSLDPAATLDAGATPPRASVESRTYAFTAPAVAGPRTLTGVQYLEGPEIHADDLAGTLRVPGAGLLLVADQRTEPAPAPAEPGAAAPLPAGPESLLSRGIARFTWQGELVGDRSAGTATMRRGVRVTHAADAPAPATDLESEELVATIAEQLVPSTDGSPSQRRIRLTRATATGAVWASYGGRELTADTVEYDAVVRLVRAQAVADNTVLLYDPKQTTPVSAKLLEWDLTRDQIQVKQPGTIVVPADVIRPGGPR